MLVGRTGRKTTSRPTATYCRPAHRIDMCNGSQRHGLRARTAHGFPRHWLRGPPLFWRWFGQLCFLGGLFELLRGFAGRARTQVSSASLPLQIWRLQPGATSHLLASPLIEGASTIIQRRDFAINDACECPVVLLVVLLLEKRPFSRRALRAEVLVPTGRIARRSGPMLRRQQRRRLL